MATRSGYFVSIKGFVPVDHNNISAHRIALEAIDAATKNPKSDGGSTTDALFKIMEIDDFIVKPTTRRGKDEPA